MNFLFSCIYDMTIFSALKVNLYPAVGTVQKNTSLVDIDSPDYDKHPLFREAKGESVTVEEITI